MNSPLDTPACLVIDLERVRILLPDLILISTELNALLEKYREQDALFNDQGPRVSVPGRVGPPYAIFASWPARPI